MLYVVPGQAHIAVNGQNNIGPSVKGQIQPITFGLGWAKVRGANYIQTRQIGNSFARAFGVSPIGVSPIGISLIGVSGIIGFSPIIGAGLITLRRRFSWLTSFFHLRAKGGAASK